jgi:hypothetical protein
MTESRMLAVRRVFTFSALMTDMDPSSPSRTFAAASDFAGLDEVKRHQVAALPEGQIGGLNGLALAAAAEAGLPAVGLLGEMPAMAPGLPYPNASAAVLRVFMELAGLDFDLGELEEYGRAMQTQLAHLSHYMSQGLQVVAQDEEAAADNEDRAGPGVSPGPCDPGLAEEDSALIQRLFRQARRDRAKAFALKKELDRLGVFQLYEDRFLDLFEPRP